jgi:hypothetical protein
MKYIGGFQGLELSAPIKDSGFHRTDQQLFVNGRSCLHVIIKALGIKKIYLPFFSCDSILEPIKKNRISFEYYHITDLFFPEKKIRLKQNEYFLYINYFGICRSAISELEKEYGNKLIVDNTQAYFSKPSGKVLQFNSFRKFFGVPNGAMLSFPKVLFEFFQKYIPEEHFNGGYVHLIERLNNNQEKAYKAFVENENRQPCEIALPSNLTISVMEGIDFKKIKSIRNKNYNYYHQKLGTLNALKLKNTIDAPLCYPFLTSGKTDKKALARSGIFIPTYWPEVLARKEQPYKFEKKMVENLLPLPVDQRYGRSDCEFVLSEIKVKLD